MVLPNRHYLYMYLCYKLNCSRWLFANGRMFFSFCKLKLTNTGNGSFKLHTSHEFLHVNVAFFHALHGLIGLLHMRNIMLNHQYENVFDYLFGKVSEIVHLTFTHRYGQLYIHLCFYGGMLCRFCVGALYFCCLQEVLFLCNITEQKQTQTFWLTMSWRC